MPFRFAYAAFWTGSRVASRPGGLRAWRRLTGRLAAASSSLAAILLCVCILASDLRAGDDGQGPEATDGSTYLSPGGFRLIPRIAAGFEYNSNLFASRLFAIPDRGEYVTPGLLITSRWARHALSADLDLNYRTFEDTGVEALDLRGRVSGVINVSKAFDVGADFAASQLHSLQIVDNLAADFIFNNRDIPSNIAGFIPVNQRSETVWARYNSWWLTNRLSVSHEVTDYGVVGLTGGGSADLGNRSTDTVTISNETAITVSHRLRLLTTVFERMREYPDDPDRNSTTRGIVGKLEYRFSPMIWTDISAAYAQENFDNPVLESAPTRSTGLGLNWSPRSYVRIRLGGTLVEEGVNFEQASTSAKGHRIDASMDYAISRRLLFSAAAGYVHTDRETTVGPRTDVDYAARMRLDYGLWRNALLAVTYDYRLSKSSDLPTDLLQQIVRLELRASF